MQSIHHAGPSLIRAIQQGESIGITAAGTWYHKNVIVRIINLFRQLFFQYDETLENAKNLAAYLSVPKRVSSDAIRGLCQNDAWNFSDIEPLVAAVKASIQSLVKKEEDEIRLLTERREKLETQHDPKQQTAIVELNRKIFSPERWSHRYAAACLDRGLLTQEYLGMDQERIRQTEPNRMDIRWLKWKLLQWQGRQFPEVDYLRGPNHDQMAEKIEYTCRYRDFISLARRNSALLDLYFQYVFKSMPDAFTNAIDLFIQAPKIQEDLRRTFLDKRIREVANNGIRFEQLATASPSGKPLKDVKLLIDGEHQSIADPSGSVRIARGVMTTVSRIFDEFEAQNTRFITMEYLQDKGVACFDGRLVDFDLSQEEWWKDLPVIRRMTREQVESTYGVPFREGYALFVIRGSRTTPDLSADGNHGWSNIIYPLGDGTFNVIAPGKFADWFPVGVLQAFYHIFHTHRAFVTVADTNEYMSSRDRISIPLPPLTENEFRHVMRDLKNELLRSRRGELVFQAQGDNCASWVRAFIGRNWPNLNIEPFLTRVEDLELPGPLAPIVQVKPCFPSAEGWQTFRRGFCSLFGAMEGHQSSDGHGGTRVVRLIDNHDWAEGVLQLPARAWRERDRVLAQMSQMSPRVASA